MSREELASAMRGRFPKKETDFVRLCDPSQLSINDMLNLLREDYMRYMSDHSVFRVLHRLLSESDICYKSYERIRKLFDAAAANHSDNGRVTAQIKELSFAITGRDIFKREIGIVDGHDSSSYFWIMPVRVLDYSDTSEPDNVAKMKSAEISIEEDDVARYLTPFLCHYYDEGLEANKQRVEGYDVDDDGNEQADTIRGFVWNLTPNFFTFDSMRRILKDIADTADALRSGKVTAYTEQLNIGRDAEDDSLMPAEETETALVADFYCRFLYRMEYMLKVGGEKGYNLISVTGS